MTSPVTNTTTKLDPGLYIVATPIGNLGDLSPRAADILAAADVIAVEDSRVTAGLLRHIGVKRPMQPYHDHNAEHVRPALVARMVGTVGSVPPPEGDGEEDLLVDDIPPDAPLPRDDLPGRRAFAN